MKCTKQSKNPDSVNPAGNQQANIQQYLSVIFYNICSSSLKNLLEIIIINHCIKALIC